MPHCKACNKCNTWHERQPRTHWHCADKSPLPCRLAFIGATAAVPRCHASVADGAADYASRRSGNQEENLRRRANGHQMPLSARAPLESRARDSRDTSAALRARSSKGTLYMNPNRRRGRPAHQRSPEDSPLRDGNRDRLIGLLTLRAAKTLEYYFMETNLTYHHWLSVRLSTLSMPHMFIRSGCSTLLALSRRCASALLGGSLHAAHILLDGVAPQQLTTGGLAWEVTRVESALCHGQCVESVRWRCARIAAVSGLDGDI